MLSVASGASATGRGIGSGMLPVTGGETIAGINNGILLVVGGTNTARDREGAT